MEGRRRDGIPTPPAARTRGGQQAPALSFQWKAWKVIGPWRGRRCYGKRTGEALVKAIPPQRRAYDPGGRLGLSRAKKLAADQLGVKSLNVLGKGTFFAATRWSIGQQLQRHSSPLLPLFSEEMNKVNRSTRSIGIGQFGLRPGTFHAEGSAGANQCRVWWHSSNCGSPQRVRSPGCKLVQSTRADPSHICTVPVHRQTFAGEGWQRTISPKRREAVEQWRGLRRQTVDGSRAHEERQTPPNHRSARFRHRRVRTFGAHGLAPACYGSAWHEGFERPRQRFALLDAFVASRRRKDAMTGRAKCG
jgi:hypothetical protein